MATIDFPPELPCPQRDGYALEHVSPLMRTEMASGRARQRRRFTSVPTMVRVSWLFTGGQAALFEGFFQHVLLDGAEWFNCPLKTPMGLKDYECRFADMYGQLTPVGADYWRVSAELEIRERQTLPEGWINILPGMVAGQSIFDQAMNREWPPA